MEYRSYTGKRPRRRTAYCVGVLLGIVVLAVLLSLQADALVIA